MKVTTIVIIVLSGSLFLVSLLFGIVANNLNKKKCDNTVICDDNNSSNSIENNTDINTTIINYKDKYDIFENIDLLNKFDVLDTFNDRVNIYSIDLDNCFNICENTTTCLGFIRFHNYCYLKNNSNIVDQTPSKDMNLFYRKNILHSNSSI
jgi:hypothetical protein